MVPLCIGTRSIGRSARLAQLVSTAELLTKACALLQVARILAEHSKTHCLKRRGPGERGGDYKGRDDIERRWASFGGEKQKLVTTKRLFDIAREYGWKEETEELDGEEKQTKKRKPVIEIRGGQLPVLATEAEKVLLENGVEIYQRGNVLVRPVIEEVDAAHGRKTKIARFVEIADVYLCDVLGRLIVWKRFDGRANKWVNTDTPPKVARTLLARDGEWKFPKVAGVISTPTLRPDGTIIDQEGYDAVTRLLLLAPPPMPPIPDKPTKNDALRALALLEDLLVEFPFVGDVDRSVALSGFITPVVRGAFPVAPMHAANAPVAGTGKSYLFDCVAAIATGRLMPVMAAGRNEEETEKRLGAAIMTGQALIDVDNVNGEIGGDALCQLLERPIVDVRVLGESRQGMIAEYERAQILERSRRGKRHRALQGVINVLSGAPYGYRYIRKSEHTSASYAIIDAEATVVRMIYELYTVRGLSIGAITRLLNEQGVATRKGISRWERSTIWAMLRNPAYKGTACFNKTKSSKRQRITRPIRLRESRHVIAPTTSGRGPSGSRSRCHLS